MIDLPPQDLTTIKRILAKHVPNCEVRAFGSRVTWTSKPHSDLDLVVLGKEKLSRGLLSTLKGEFEDSAMPVTVDLLDWHRISPEFRKNIDKQCETIQHPHDGESNPEGWAYRKVAEIAEIIGGGTPKTEKEEYWGGEIPWLTPKDLSGEHPRYVSHGERNITKAGLENSSACIVPPKTVLLTSRAPVGYVAMAKDPIATNQGFRSLVVNQENDPEFVYYLLLNNTDYLKQHAAGSTFQELSGSTLKSLEFLMPPLPEQKCIAHILGALDDKIELNRKTNETLEAMARALFESWFVDFDPVRRNIERRRGKPVPAAGGMAELDLSSVASAKEDALFPDSFVDSELGRIPKGWRVESFGDHLTTERGLSYNGAGLREDGSGLPMHNLNSIYEGGGYKHEGIKYYAGEYRKKHLLRPGDMIVSNTEQGFDHLLIGHAAIVPERYGDIGLFSHHIYRVRPQSKSPFTPDYLVHLFNTTRWHYWISGFSNGTTINMLPMDALALPLLVVPPVPLVQAFTTFAGASRRKTEAQLDQSRTLAAARDALLPKLLSGEIRIKDAEKFVGDVA